jgi:hypothetical protein
MFQAVASKVPIAPPIKKLTYINGIHPVAASGL